MTPIWVKYGSDMVQVWSFDHTIWIIIGMIGKWYVYRNHIMSISDTYLNHINLYSGLQYGWGPKYYVVCIFKPYLSISKSYPNHIRTISADMILIWSRYVADMVLICLICFCQGSAPRYGSDMVRYATDILRYAYLCRYGPDMVQIWSDMHIHRKPHLFP